MTLEFVKAHTGKDGKNYLVGQTTDIQDPAEAQDLIRQGYAKETKSAGRGADPQPPNPR